MGRLLIGVDLGGTNLRTGLLDVQGTILEKFKEGSRAHDGHVRVLQRIAMAIGAQVDRAVREGHEVLAIGVGAPGVIDSAQGTVVRSPNFPDWDNLPLKRELERALRLPVFIENDANAAALGERWRGAAKNISSVVLLTLGTGVGGGIVLDGRIWRGADGMAGELGHMTIYPEGRPCGCGNRGCLEMYASARGVQQNYRELLAAKGRPAPAELTARAVASAAGAGDAEAAEAFRIMGRDLGIGIANLVNIFNPDRIVLGGGVRDAWTHFIAAAEAEVGKRAFAAPAQRARIVASELGDDAGMVGAAAVALQGLEGPCADAAARVN